MAKRNGNIIIVPDFKGRVSTKLLNENSGFLAELRAARPNDDILVALNSPDKGPLLNAMERLPDAGFLVSISENGMPATLSKAYDEALKHDPECIIRLDTAEHPIDQIDYLTDGALNIHGMAVGDLRHYPEELMPRGSFEWYYHNSLVPSVTGALSRGKIPHGLSGAHGFLAFDANQLAKINEGAKNIWQEVVKANEGPVTWGYDFMSILSAIVWDIPLTIRVIEPYLLRNRSALKAAEQLRCLSLVGVAAYRVFPMT